MSRYNASMTYASRISRSTLLLLVSACVLASLPFIVAAQSDSLEAAIREQVMSDPRASQMSSAQIDALVASLTKSARQQGVTAQDIAWKPAPESELGGDEIVESQPSAVCSLPQFMCSINTALGLDGSDLKIPIGLGITSMALIVFLGLYIEMHKKKHEEAQNPAGQ